MKNLVALAALPLMAAPAFAGPYVNVEANTGLAGSDYVGTVTEAHIGYEGTSGKVTYYGQVGPALVTPDGGDTDVQISGKIGASVAATENLGIYGEYYAISTDGDLGSNIKVGVKYNF